MDTDSVTLLQSLLAEEKYAEASELITKKTNRKFVHQDISYALLYCLIKTEKWEDVIQVVDGLPEEQRTTFAKYKGLAHYELGQNQQAKQLLEKKDQDTFTTCLRGQIAYKDSMFSQSRADFAEVARLKKTADVEHNYEVLLATEGVSKFTVKTTSWEGIFYGAVGHYVRGKYASVVELVVSNYDSIKDITPENKAMLLAVVFAAVGSEPSLKSTKLPFTREDLAETDLTRLTIAALDGKDLEESEVKELAKQGTVSGTQSYMSIIHTRAKKGKEVLFGLCPFCSKLPPSMRERVASIIADACTPRQLESLLEHPELCTLAAVQKARSYGMERLAIAILSCVPQKSDLLVSVNAAKVVEDARTQLMELHHGLTRIKEAQTGHQGAEADNTTKATELKPIIRLKKIAHKH